MILILYMHDIYRKFLKIIYAISVYFLKNPGIFLFFIFSLLLNSSLYLVISFSGTYTGQIQPTIPYQLPKVMADMLRF